MKEILPLLLFLIITKIGNAQEYTVSFTASGAATTINSVKVENLTQGTSLTIYGHGSLLQLYGIATGFEELNAQPEQLDISPNPMDGNARLSFNIPSATFTIVSIYDATGRKVINYAEFLKSGNHQFKINLLTNGVYFISVIAGNKKQTGKLICRGNSTKGYPSLVYTNFEEISKTKNTREIANSMQYNPGDILKLTGESSYITSVGYCKTVKTIIISANTTIDFNFIPCYIDGIDNYKVVQIGTQTWMAENLRFWGSGITTVNDSLGWISYSNLALCSYYRGVEYNYNTYGMLYNYLSVINSSVCPTGWHVPNNAEWQTLSDNLGGISGALQKLKVKGNSYWDTGNTGSDESGFSALGSGGRMPNATFTGLKQNCYFWSSTPYDATKGTVWGGWYNSNSFTYWNPDKKYGYAIRCIKN